MTSKFSEVIAARHDYARDWKRRTNGRVVGYLCTYNPEEIFSAAGMLPVRIFGSREAEDVTAPYVPRSFCSHCRDCLAQGLKGRYDYLDGISTAHCCLNMMQAFDSWRRHIEGPMPFYVNMPNNVDSKAARAALIWELKDLKNKVEAFTGKQISTEQLQRAIDSFDRNRRLMQQVYELRKKERPSITGALCMEMVMASQVMDKDEHSRLVEDLLANPPAEGKEGTRLLLAGHTQNVDLVRFVETLGFNVVADDLCFGSRYFSENAGASQDPIAALADRYLKRARCPLKDIQVTPVRPNYVLGLAKEYNVSAAILVRQQFCDPHEYEFPGIKRLLEANNVPTIVIEEDVTMPVGVLRTRFEALLELVEQESLFGGA